MPQPLGELLTYQQAAPLPAPLTAATSMEEPPVVAVAPQPELQPSGATKTKAKERCKVLLQSLAGQTWKDVKGGEVKLPSGEVRLAAASKITMLLRNTTFIANTVPPFSIWL